jgi:hypothetical protein
MRLIRLEKALHMMMIISANQQGVSMTNLQLVYNEMGTLSLLSRARLW